MEIFDRILELINANLIYCLPAIILTLFLLQVFFKDKFQINKAYQIVKWIIIGYAVVNLINFLIGIIMFPDQSAFLNRATGKYWPNYWLMMFSVILLPFSLFYKRIGTKPFYLFFISFMMKIGWFFHFYVILLASHFSYSSWTETESHWLNSPWSGFFMNWIQGFILALILIGLTTIIERNERKKTVHNKELS